MNENWISCRRCGQHLRGSLSFDSEMCEKCREDDQELQDLLWLYDAIMDFVLFVILAFVLLVVLVVL